MKKKNCLLILPRSVFPTVSGYALKNKNLIELLDRTYHLTLVVMKETSFSDEEAGFYKTHSKHCILWVRPKLKCLVGTVAAFLTGKPLQAGYYYDRALQKKINETIEHYDIAVAVLERTIAYLKDTPEHTIRVFDIVDSIALNYQHSKENTSSFFWKILYSIEGQRLMQYEDFWIRKSDITYFINQEECSYWKKSGHVCWLPHGVKQELLSYDKTEPQYKHSVAFIGKMDYQPNVDAMLWYIRHVHSVIGKEIPLIIVGASPAKELQQQLETYQNITITGFVDDPYIILNSAMALIAPMQTGGGIQNKVLEGMALGKINVISTLAARPIVGSEAGTHYLIADTPEEYIKTLQDIKKHPEAYSHIGEHAREHIRENFTWEAYNRLYIQNIHAMEQ